LHALFERFVQLAQRRFRAARLDSHRRRTRQQFHHPLVTRARVARLEVVVRKRSEYLAFVGEDRGGPDGPYAERRGKLQEPGPLRIGRYLGYDDGLARGHCLAARPGHR